MGGIWRVIAIGCLFGGAIATTYVCKARAGYPASSPIHIDLTTRTATGSFGSVRNSGDSNSFILSSLTGNSSSLTLTLWAHDITSGGLGVICSTTNTNIIRAFQKVSPDAYVAFGWDPSATCTSFNVGMGSETEPKSP